MAVNYSGHLTSLNVEVGGNCLQRCNLSSNCIHSLQYDWSPDWRFGMWHIGSMSGKGGKFCEEPRKTMIDVCFLLEVRWRGQDFRILGMEGR